MSRKPHSYDARQVLARLHMNVALIAEERANSAVEDLRELAGADFALEEAAFDRRMDELVLAYGFQPQREVKDKRFAYADGTGFIPIHGTLINRFNYSWGFVTGYGFIRSHLRQMMDDDDVKKIILDVNSGGGEAAGCFELAREIKAASKKKPILAVVDSNCFSGAYALSTGATEIVITPSGGAGSIGVIGMHISVKDALDDMGVEVTVFRGGKYKAETNPFEKLTDGAKERIDEMIQTIYGKFTSLVAENRAMDEAVIRDTKARVYLADEALALGLVDRIENPSEAISVFVYGDEDDSDEQEIEMADENKGAGAATEVTSEQKAAIIAESNARIKGITTCEEAKGREALANHFAFDTAMTVDQAKAALAVAPKAEAAPPAPAPAKGGEGTEAKGGEGTGTGTETTGNPGFAAAMDQGGTPGVGANVTGKDEKPSRAQASIALLGVGNGDKSKSRAQSALN